MIWFQGYKTVLKTKQFFVQFLTSIKILIFHPNNKIHENQCTTNIDEVTIFDQLFVTMTADNATSSYHSNITIRSFSEG